MTELVRTRVKYVIGPDGSPLTITDLPPSNTRRWVIRRKAEVVAAVRGGLLSLDEACQRYTLTVEEFLSWQCSIDEHGLAGLRTTRIQQYRHWQAWPILPSSVNKTTVSFVFQRKRLFYIRANSWIVARHVSWNRTAHLLLKMANRKTNLPRRLVQPVCPSCWQIK